MKKTANNQKNGTQGLEMFSGIPATEKRLYWGGSPWNAFRLLAKKRG